MREKLGEKLKLPFVPSRPISRNQFCRSCGRSHTCIYICTGPADAWPNLQTHGRTQTGGRTRRSTDADADARTQTQTHGRRRTDADASARWRTDATYSCVQCVGGKIVLVRSSRRRTRLDERTRTFEVYYMYILGLDIRLHGVCVVL